MSELDKSRFKEIDLSRLRTYEITELDRRVRTDAFARPLATGSSMKQLLDSLPNVLAAKDLIAFATHFAEAVRRKKAIIVMFGGHVVKTGLAPIIIDWIKKGMISALATHGAGAIHDTEIALFGQTSEDVAEGLADGSFGMCRSTADFINKSLMHEYKMGFGESLGEALIKAKAQYQDLSLLCSAYKNGIPLTISVALGTDIVHQHPSADGALIGEASLRDFRVFTHSVAELTEGAIVMNIGSAVIMPEVFLKALTIARNLGFPAHRFITANFDMFTQYRPMQNVLNRPTLTGGQKFNFIGHHEIMIPLLNATIYEILEKTGD